MFCCSEFFRNTMDESYQRFLEEMTNEIVRLDLSTDKALKNVFRKHIKHNIGKLDEVNYNNLFIFIIKIWDI